MLFYFRVIYIDYIVKFLQTLFLIFIIKVSIGYTLIVVATKWPDNMNFLVSDPKSWGLSYITDLKERVFNFVQQTM